MPIIILINKILYLLYRLDKTGMMISILWMFFPAGKMEKEPL